MVYTLLKKEAIMSQITEATQLFQQAQQYRHGQPAVAIEAAEKAKKLFAATPQLAEAKKLLTYLYFEEGERRCRQLRLFMEQSEQLPGKRVQLLKQAKLAAQGSESCFIKAGKMQRIPFRKI